MLNHLKGGADCLAWSKSKENILAISSNNDIRIYDIRKSSSALRYVPNAHQKKIFSIDWSSLPSEEILLSSSRDKNIKLWNFNMINEKFMEKLIEVPCWKAKFTPFGLSFGVIPTCQPNQFNFKENYPTLTNSLSFAAETFNRSNPKNEAYIYVSQITGFNEAKINKIVSAQQEMILNFDFVVQKDSLNIVTWNRDQHIRIHELDLSQFLNRDYEKAALKIRDETETSDAIPSGLNSNKQNATFPSSALPLYSNTTNSSRKSSISDCTGYGTSPAAGVTMITVSTLPVSSQNKGYISNTEKEGSLNLANEDQDFIGPIRNTNNAASNNSHNLLKSSSSTLAAHDFLKKFPKFFGAKFSGLPGQFVIIFNEGSLLSQKKNKDIEKTLSNLKRSNKNSKLSKINSVSSKNQQMSKKIRARFCILDVSNLIQISRELAESYLVKMDDLRKLCEQNIQVASKLKKYEVVKIWDIIKFITMNGHFNFSFNPDHGRPWSCSIFGRPLVNNIIDNCIKSSDVQTAVMIITKLKQYDFKTSSFFDFPMFDNFFHDSTSKVEIEIKDPKNSSSTNLKSENQHLDKEIFNYQKNFSLVDPNRFNQFDQWIKFYCDILNKWGLFNKRIEIFDFVNQKPQDMDEKYECFKRCVKCSKITQNSKCKTCNIYTTYCSLCELPVNGLSIYCSSCGHGGHYDHLIEWFKRHDDCSLACGCRCVDYL